MKKILALAVIAASSAAFAGSATLEAQSGSGRNGAADSNVISLTVGQKFTPSLAGDVGFTSAQQSGNKALETRAELGLTYSRPVGAVNVYVRGGVGQRYIDGADNAYFSVEPGVSYAITPQLAAHAGYRYRTAFDSGKFDETGTIRVGVDYALTSTDAIGLRLDRVRGDVNQNVLALNYTRSF